MTEVVNVKEDKSASPFVALRDNSQDVSKEASNRSWKLKVFVCCFLGAIVVTIGTTLAVTLVQRQQQAESNSRADSYPTHSPVQMRPADIAFNIQITYLTPVSNGLQTAIQDAVDRLQAVITEDIATTAIIQAGDVVCGIRNNEEVLVDDILIYVSFKAIDGAGGILGQAGPCGTDQQGRIRVGKMEFDTSDFSGLVTAQTAQATVLHEMVHVLGFGTLWPALSLVDSNYHYLGRQGNTGNIEVGGIGQALVENGGDSGTIGGHWRESVYGNELMTGYIADRDAPMSRLTIRALADLGYAVDVGQADEYVVTSGRRRRLRRKTGRVLLKNDTLINEMAVLKTMSKPVRKLKRTNSDRAGV